MRKLQAPRAAHILRWLVCLCCLLPAPRVVRPQIRAHTDEGAVALGLLLRRLQTTASVLHTGAHPDDEDSALIARLARGDGARVGYLSLNRGEGGQNRIGPELFDALGVIRTEELLQARQLDGGDQFFTRTFDFGFTKTRAEAAARWPEHEVLADMVRVIRAYRPLIVISRWSGTPADEHGQHQYAGYLTPLAVRAAADPTQFPESLSATLRPWQVRKLYVSILSGADAQANAATLVEVDTGRFDPLLGRSYYELAMEGRSQHKSQGEGALELRGAQTSRVRLVARAPDLPAGSAREQSIYDGLDTSIRGIAALTGVHADKFDADLAALQRDAAHALAQFAALDPRANVAALSAGLAHVRQARATLAALSPATAATTAATTAAATVEATAAARADADFLLAQKEREFGAALLLAAGVRVEALTDVATVAPGDTFTIAVRTFAPDAQLAGSGGQGLATPPGWRVEQIAAPQSNDALGVGRDHPQYVQYYRVTVPATAAPTQPYWLQQPRIGDLYDWTDTDTRVRTLPFSPAELRGLFSVTFGGEVYSVTAPVQFRALDAVRGEVRRELNVVPALTVEVRPALLIVPAGPRATTRRIVVQVTNNTRGASSGRAQLQLPATMLLQARPAAAPFTLAPGARATLSFTLDFKPPPNVRVRAADSYEIGAQATTDAGAVFAATQRSVSYPHIQTHRLYAPAAVRARTFDLQVAPVRVGYIMGSGDEVPQAIERLGLPVTLLTEQDLTTGDLTRFDTIVVGVRASQTRPDFVAANARLLEFMRQGGALIVQYQRPDYTRQNLPPFAAAQEVPAQPPGASPTIARVVDETAAVTVLQPAHPAFNFPNKITAADWQGWVQERNLYNFTTYDPRYVPLLEAHDADAAPQTGGEVYARIGRGHYVYTSYAWFRQLPAGVPGAYRLFANLLSLPQAPSPGARRGR